MSTVTKYAAGRDSALVTPQFARDRLRWYADWLDFVGDQQGSAFVTAALDKTADDPFNKEHTAAALAGMPLLIGPGFGTSGLHEIPVQVFRDLAANWRQIAAIFDFRALSRDGRERIAQEAKGQLVAQHGPLLSTGTPLERTTAAIKLAADAGIDIENEVGLFRSAVNAKINADANSFSSGALSSRGLLAPVGTSWVNIGTAPESRMWIPEKMPTLGRAARIVMARASGYGAGRAALVMRIGELVGKLPLDGSNDEAWDFIEQRLDAVDNPELRSMLEPLFLPQQPTAVSEAIAALETGAEEEPYSLTIKEADLPIIRGITEKLGKILGMPVAQATVLKYIVQYMRARSHLQLSDYLHKVGGALPVVSVVLGGPTEQTPAEWVKTSDIRSGDVMLRLGGAEIKFPKLPLNGFRFDKAAPPQSSVGGGTIGMFYGQWGSEDYRSDPVVSHAATLAARLWDLQHNGIISIADAMRTPAAAAAAATAVAKPLMNASYIPNITWSGQTGRPAVIRSERGQGLLSYGRFGDLLVNPRVNRATALDRIQDLVDRYAQHHLGNDHIRREGVRADWDFVNGPDWVRTHFDKWLQLRYDKYIGTIDLAAKGAEMLGYQLDPVELHDRIIQDGLVAVGLDPLRRYVSARMAGAGDIAAYRGMAEPKLPQLFDLNSEILAGHIRFRVLQDGDPYHFIVGADTNCCQVVGSAGEDAAVQSYVNSHAGVLVLEANFGGEWTLVAQSYFHWVPQTSQYILDNVEHNATAVKHLGQIYDTDLRSIYALLGAEVRARLPHVTGILAGADYSKIGDKNTWGTHSQEIDPRRYLEIDNNTNDGDDDDIGGDEDEHEDEEDAEDENGATSFPGYTDYDHRNSLDLNNPKFNVKSPQSPGGK